MRGLKDRTASSPAAPTASALRSHGDWRKRAAPSAFSTWTPRPERCSRARSWPPARGRACTPSTSPTTTRWRARSRVSNPPVGPVAFLVNNAGWDRAAAFLDTTPDFWRKIVAINLFGPFNMQHVVLRGMAARGFGRVVSIASDAGRVGSSGEAVYSACKGGVIALTKTLARELVGKGIILNTLCPGPTDTAILRSFLEGSDGARIAEGLKRAIPMRRLGVPEDYPGTRRFPAVGRRRLHHRPDHQRLGRPHHAWMRHDETAIEHRAHLQSADLADHRRQGHTRRRRSRSHRAAPVRDVLAAIALRRVRRRRDVDVVADDGDSRRR